MMEVVEGEEPRLVEEEEVGASPLRGLAMEVGVEEAFLPFPCYSFEEG